MSTTQMRMLVALGALAATLAGIAQAATPARATTRPGVVYTVTATITNTSITLTHKAAGKLGLHRLPRGAIIRYRVVNHGTRPYVFQIWTVETGTIRPNKMDSLLVNWNYRGRFVYKTIYRGKPFGPNGTVIVY